MAASLDFDGSSDYINVGAMTSIDGATEFTMMAWANMNASAASGDDAIAGRSQLDTEAQDNILFCMYRSAPQIFLSLETDAGGAGYIKTDGLSSTDDTWYHWAWTWNASVDEELLGGSVFYQNGESVSMIDSSGGTSAITAVIAASTRNLNIGLRTTKTDTWDGQIAYYSIHDRALTQDEVKESMYKPEAIVDNRLGYWPLTTTAAPDLSGNGNTGTVSGTVVASLDGPPIYYQQMQG